MSNFPDLFFGETRELTPITYEDMENELRFFCEEIQKAVPYNLKFYGNVKQLSARRSSNGLGAFQSMRTNTVADGIRYHTCFVGIDGDPLIVGGASTNEIHDGKMVYTVYSDNIENKKFSTGKGTRSAGSKKLAIAIKNARKYLRKRPEVETAKILTTWCAEIVSDERARAKQGLEEGIFENLMGNHTRLNYPSDGPAFVNDRFMQELLRLSEQGAIQDQSVLNAIMEIQTKMKEVERLDPAKPGWHIVFTQKNRVGQDRIVMVKMMVQSNPSSWNKTFDAEGDAYVMEPHEVPEIVQGRMAVLGMLEDGTHVDGVGVKLSDTCFYVDLEPETVGSAA